MKLTRYYNTCYNHKGMTFYCSRCKVSSDEKYQDERGVWYCPNCRPEGDMVDYIHLYINVECKKFSKIGGNRNE